MQRRLGPSAQVVERPGNRSLPGAGSRQRRIPRASCGGRPDQQAADISGVPIRQAQRCVHRCGGGADSGAAAAAVAVVGQGYLHDIAAGIQIAAAVSRSADRHLQPVETAILFVDQRGYFRLCLSFHQPRARPARHLARHTAESTRRDRHCRGHFGGLADHHLHERLQRRRGALSELRRFHHQRRGGRSRSLADAVVDAIGGRCIHRDHAWAGAGHHSRSAHGAGPPAVHDGFVLRRILGRQIGAQGGPRRR